MTTENHLEYNIISVIRHSAAILVIFSHSFVLYRFDGVDPLHCLTQYFDLSEIAVFVFFALSGRLIFRSCENSSSSVIFFKKRLIRIFPALFACVLITVLFSSLFIPSGETLVSYLLDKTTISYLLNVFFVGGYSLPNVFDENPYPSIANGSLWTLRYELIMYFLTPVVVLSKNKKATAVFITLIALACWCFLFNHERTFMQNLAKLGFVYFLSLLMCELNVKIKSIYIFISIFVMLVLAAFKVDFAVKVFLAINIVLFFQWLYSTAFKTRWIISKKINFDISYGLYIYAFFVQQLVILLAKPQSAYTVFFVSLVITVFLASMSWLFVEKPTLKFK